MTTSGSHFLDRFGERQPDADIVVLPPVEPDERPPAAPSTVEDAVQATVAVVDHLLAVADLTATHTWNRWQRDQRGLHAHRTRARVTLEAAGVQSAFVSVGEALADDGWEVRAIEAREPWVTATAAGLTVDVAVERAHLVLTAVSPALRLPEGRA